MQLSQLRKISDKRKKIVGRGPGSGKGMHTSGRGMKGQNSRAGTNLRPLFEGGQNPLSRRIPHSPGFKKHIKDINEIVMLEALNIFDDGASIEVSDLFKTGLITGKSTPKILDGGELKKKLIIVGINCSKAAKEKIEERGGSVSWK